MATIESMALEIRRALAEYSVEVANKVDIAIADVGKELLTELKTTSPIQKGAKGGAYRKGWRIKEVYGKTGNKRIVVHNASEYRLTHLLEFGHLNRDGTKTEAQPHIIKAEQQAIKEYARRVREAIEK